MRELGARGGAATAKKGSEYYRAIGAMGGRAGKGKQKRRKSMIVLQPGESITVGPFKLDDDGREKIITELNAE